MHSLTELFHRIGAYGRPRDVSVNGWRGDQLFGWITVVLVVVFLIVLVQLVLVALRSRDEAPPSASRGDDARSRFIVAFTTLLLVLAVDVVALWHGKRDLNEALLRVPADSEHPILVEVMAQQWAWSFRLAGEDGKFGTDDDIVTLHTLRLPVGRPARLELRSKDVIHSLYLPHFRMKRDAQPGATTELLLEPTEVGTFEIACAQHCGANHYLMRATLDVVEPPTFQRYVRDESTLARERAAARPSDSQWAWAFGEAQR